MAAVRQVLQAQGLPMNAENLNRGMQMVSAAQDAIAQGMSPEEAQKVAQEAGRAASPINAQIDRVMQENPAQMRARAPNRPASSATAAPPAPGVRTDATQEPGPAQAQPANDEPEAVHNAAEERAEVGYGKPGVYPQASAVYAAPASMSAQLEAIDPTKVAVASDATGAPVGAPLRRSEAVASGAPPGRRGGTINGAQRFADDYGAEGNIMNPHHVGEGTQPRQADETGVNQYGIAAGLLAPFALAAPGVGAAAGAAGRMITGAGAGLRNSMVQLRTNAAPNIKPQYGPPANGQRVGSEQFGPPRASYGPPANGQRVGTEQFGPPNISGPPNMGQRMGTTQHGPPPRPQYGPKAPTMRERLLNREAAMRESNAPTEARNNHLMSGGR